MQSRRCCLSPVLRSRARSRGEALGRTGGLGLTLRAAALASSTAAPSSPPPTTDMGSPPLPSTTDAGKTFSLPQAN